MGKVASLMGRVRSIPHFGIGLKRLGFELAETPKEHPEPDDILVIWNRLPTMDKFAKQYEAVGAKVIVAENGWIGENNYTVALTQHNGGGRWFIGPESRWPSFGIELKPWRTKGDHILLVPQRGMGTPPVAMPRDWTERTLTTLAWMTKRKIVTREPRMRARTKIEGDFDNCHAVITWASGGGIKAIVAGIPVFYEMPGWIGDLGGGSNRFPRHDLEHPYMGDREPMLHKLSWAMWTADEVESGEPFRCVLRLLED